MAYNYRRKKDWTSFRSLAIYGPKIQNGFYIWNSEYESWTTVSGILVQIGNGYYSQ